MYIDIINNNNLVLNTKIKVENHITSFGIYNKTKKNFLIIKYIVPFLGRQLCCLQTGATHINTHRVLTDKGCAFKGLVVGWVLL